MLPTTICDQMTYCEQLSTLIEVFADPLTAWLSNLEPDPRARQRSDYTIEVVRDELDDKHATIGEALFSNIRQLHDCSKELLSALVEASDQGSKSIVMDTFRRHAPFLTMYSSYTANFTAANMLMQRLQQDPRFSAFIKCGELQLRCKGLTLPSFLILPVQRVPRYGLLIKEAMKMCSDETAVQLLSATLSLTSTVTKRIDSKIEEEERRSKLIDVQNMLGIELLAPAREFIRDGTLAKICHTGRKDFYFVLCTDKLIYATDTGGFLRSGQKYSVNKNYNLHDLLIVVPEEVNDQNKSFYICSKDKAFEMEAGTKEVCSLWVDDIIKLKNRRTVQTGQKPWYVAGERASGFSLYTMDRNSVCVSTFRVHPGADLSSGVISFSEIIAIVVDDEPSVLQRPGSLTGYKRMDSSNMPPTLPGPDRSESMSVSSQGSQGNAPDAIERRSSFSLMIKHAFGRSPALSDEKARLNRMSEPIPIVPKYPPSGSGSGEIDDVLASCTEQGNDDIEGRESDDMSPDPFTDSGRGGRPSLSRMNTADFKLFGYNSTGMSPKAGGGKPFSGNEDGKPTASPFVYSSKPPPPPVLDINTFVPTAAPRPQMPKHSPPAIPSATKAPKVSSPHPSSPHPKSENDNQKEKGVHTKGAKKTTNSTPVAIPLTGLTSEAKGNIAPPPPPAAKKANANIRPCDVSYANRPGAARKVSDPKPVKAAVAKGSKAIEHRKAYSTSHSTAHSTAHSTGHNASHSIAHTAHSSRSNSDLSERSVEKDKKSATASPMLSEKGKRESSRDLMECMAMVDAVAGVCFESHSRSKSGELDSHTRPKSTESDSGQAVGNVKCVLCETILAYKMGTDPNAVVNQHMVQVHGLE
jgi:hypothetical protein